jgi:twinkle protein
MDFNKWLESLGISPKYDEMGRYLVKCPKPNCVNRHKNDLEKLSVNPETESVYCHHCEWQEFKNTKPIDQYTKPKRKKYKKPEPIKIVPLHDSVIKWFEGRKIDQNILARFNVTNKTFKGCRWIAYPYYKAGKLVNVKLRNRKKDFSQTKECEPVVYGYDWVVNQSEIIITEGEMDVMAFHQVGITSVCSSPFGGREKALDSFSAIASHIESAKKIIIAVDNDEDGLGFQKRLLELIGPGKCHIAKYPEGCKDPNDVLMKHGPEALKEVVKNAPTAPLTGIEFFGEYADAINEIYESGGKIETFSTGIQNLDDHFKFKLGELALWTGRPNGGKSEFVDQLIVNTIRRYQWRWAVFSPENTPRDHGIKLLKKLLRKPFHKGAYDTAMVGDSRMSQKEMLQGLQVLNEHVIIIKLERKDCKLKTILDIMQGCKLRFNITGFILDPWNEIVQDREGWETETDYVSRAIADIRSFAVKTNTHFNLVAHPTKIRTDDRTGKRRTANLGDISGSQHFENKLDVGGVVYRDQSEDYVTKVWIEKVRDQFNVGKPGTAKLSWNRLTGELTRYKGNFENKNGKARTEPVPEPEPPKEGQNLPF